MQDVIFDLDDQPRGSSRRRAHALLTAGLLGASTAFVTAVWIGSTAPGTSATEPRAPETDVAATSTPAPTASPFTPSLSTVRIGNGFVVIDRPTADAVLFRWVGSPTEASERTGAH